MKRRDLRSLVGIGAALLLAGCSDSSAPTDSGPDFDRVGTSSSQVATVTVTPSDVQVESGETVQLTATARDRKGKVVTGVAFTWSSSAAAIASVSATGLVSGVSVGGPVTISASTGGKKPVVGTSNVTVLVPNWIVYSSVQDGYREVWMMRPDGSQPTQVTHLQLPEPHPDLSPDGRKIAFSRGAWPNQELWVINRDGTGLTAIYQGGGAHTPTWSPDGTRLAFGWYQVGIFVINADGTGLRQVTSGNDFSPEWSPDGTKLAFSRALAVCHGDIYLVNEDGSGLQRLTTTTGTCGSTQSTNPSWSPDGQSIAYMSSGGLGQSEIFVMSASGANQTRLTFDGANDDVPSWSPDGLNLVFQSNRSGNWEIWRMAADGSSPVGLTLSYVGDQDEPSWR